MLTHTIHLTNTNKVFDLVLLNNLCKNNLSVEIN